MQSLNPLHLTCVWVPFFLPPLSLPPSHTFPDSCFFCLCSLLQPSIHPFFCPITVIHHSLSSSSHYYPAPPTLCLSHPPVTFLPLFSCSHHGCSPPPFICLSNIICLLIPSSSLFSALRLIFLYLFICHLRAT